MSLEIPIVEKMEQSDVNKGGICLGQLEFNLPAIDENETKKAVECALEKYMMYVLSQSLDRLPKVTQSFTLVPPSNTNEFHSSTEDAAIANVDYDRERMKYIKWVYSAVNRLSYQEREIIIKRYMDTEEVYDYELYNQLGMSERKYYRVKARAFYKLAFALKIEQYKNKEATA